LGFFCIVEADSWPKVHVAPATCNSNNNITTAKAAVATSLKKQEMMETQQQHSHKKAGKVAAESRKICYWQLLYILVRKTPLLYNQPPYFLYV